mmetsp:Transcript_316/g.429  ORF Transcript_316/g.429 Transcript_316/m.429 type:complete len:222 (-) Transcript_316:139-804(-)|eukprot:CAMPEP_0194048880 /NCGR_PEP_ID=MMETSP0009_2-20130614/28868_1 /TAXON_ID=210454 /ORGANISM="Grammatophora oceanica, Strain CCMP 410" /LENGTH=221 /DNA_ID=CAMNT_0038694893 /DNA_START=90 /DNA_END=755 /DNA_ORIENTATION=+
MNFRSLGFVSTFFGPFTIAFPWGPGSCNSPDPFGPAHAVGSPGLSGTLDDGDFIVTVAGEKLTLNGPNRFAPGEYPIKLEAGCAEEFKGFLVRLSSDEVADTTGLLTSSQMNVEDSLVSCGDMLVGSLSHLDNAPKQAITGTINWPLVTDNIRLDVSVVVSNNALDGSVYYISNFELETTNAKGKKKGKSDKSTKCSKSSKSGKKRRLAGSVDRRSGVRGL